ncbi:MAG TPA: threonine/serine dehydratase [Herpetosiphonaceae bacterium]|nr:threonine/serine dehydratase [Herpetosiphonaceae bacterium]
MALTFADITAAADRLEGIAHRTPVQTSHMFNDLVGREVFFKAEQLQRTGSFKFRGAYNRLSQLDAGERERGVIAFSSGNHAQGVALAAQLLGVPATIVMPDNAPPVKIAATRAYGATIVLYDAARQSREEITRAIAEENGLTVVPPFNDERIIAGQGTAALELMTDVAGLDTLVVPVGGGGLISGWALAARSLNPSIRIIGVEPEGADDVRRSLAEDRIVEIPAPTTIADGVRTTAPGSITFALMRELVDEVVLVSDDQIMRAVRWIALHMKQVLEPTGALTTAALLAGLHPADSHRIGTVFCGGNVAPDVFIKALQAD